MISYGYKRIHAGIPGMLHQPPSVSLKMLEYHGLVTRILCPSTAKLQIVDVRQALKDQFTECDDNQ